jgi:protein-tyrosine phosphatase
MSFNAYLLKGNTIWKQDDLIYLYLLTPSLDVVSVIEQQEEKERKMLKSSAQWLAFLDISLY